MAFRKLSPDVKDRLLEAIRLGATYELACQYAGISRQSLLRYRKDVAFVTELEKAEGQAVVGWLAKIEKAASDGEWTAAAWKLERRYPELYGRRVQEVRGDPDAPIRVTLSLGERTLNDDELPAPHQPRALTEG
jgi:hypothetical protein